MKNLFTIFVVFFVSTVSAAEFAEFDVLAIANDTVVKPEPSLPSLEPYTEQAVREKLALHKQQGVASTERMVGNFEARKFYLSGLIQEWSKRQGQFPKAIFIRDGLVNLKQVQKDNPKSLVKMKDGSFLAKVPIIVSHNGILLIDEKDRLLLSEERGSFLVNAGGLYIFDSQVIAWRESTQTPAHYTGDRKSFRPFLTSLGGSFSYLINSYFESLGAKAQRMSWGVSFMTHTSGTIEKSPAETAVDIKAPPSGWIIGSTFVDMYFGFFSYEAEDIAIINNVYINNIVYGIDPHDRSSGLIIAKNKVYGTVEKHGIIISREVNESYIFDNEVYDNNRSGIMLDRSSEHNIVAYNKSYDNGGDGITIYESSHNLLWGNKVYSNKEHGIRVRNSIDVSVQNNAIVGNLGTAVYFHIRDLSDHDYRDLILDPYKQVVSGDVAGGFMGFNGTGAIFAENVESLKLGNLNLRANGKGRGSLGLMGDLLAYQTDITRVLWGEQKAAVSLIPISVEN